MPEKLTPTKSKQTIGNLFVVFVLCAVGWLCLVLFVLKWISTDFDTALEHFCSFVDGCLND